MILCVVYLFGHFAQGKNRDLEGQLSKEVANGVELEKMIQDAEEEHAKEAQTVKRTILALQRALKDKVNQADRLALQVEAVASKSLEFEKLIAVAKADAQEAREQADRRTTELSAKNTELSVAIDGIQNDIAALRDQLARSQERNAQLASANRDLKASLQIAEDGADTKAEQAQQLDDALKVRCGVVAVVVDVCPWCVSNGVCSWVQCS